MARFWVRLRCISARMMVMTVLMIGMLAGLIRASTACITPSRKRRGEQYYGKAAIDTFHD